MNSLDDMKALWHAAKTDTLPSSKEMLRLIRKFRSQKLRNKWLSILAAVAIGGMMVSVLIRHPFQFAATYIGGGLVIIACILLAATNIKSLKRFYQLEDSDNVNFLAFLAQTRKNQIRYYQKTMVQVVGLCAAGWVLYMYELLYRFPAWCIGIYALMTIYLAIMWFVVRPRSFKRDERKLNATRERVEQILKQLE